MVATVSIIVSSENFTPRPRRQESLTLIERHAVKKELGDKMTRAQPSEPDSRFPQWVFHRHCPQPNQNQRYSSRSAPDRFARYVHHPAQSDGEKTYSRPIETVGDEGNRHNYESGDPSQMEDCDRRLKQHHDHTYDRKIDVLI